MNLFNAATWLALVTTALYMFGVITPPDYQKAVLAGVILLVAIGFRLLALADRKDKK